MAENSSQQQSEPAGDSLPSPLVFQCGKCRIIIGDSFSFSSSSQQNQTITLATASNIKRIPEFHTSTTGPDVLSSYVMFHCENCEVVKGFSFINSLLVHSIRSAVTILPLQRSSTTFAKCLPLMSITSLATNWDELSMEKLRTHGIPRRILRLRIQ
jgi:hypothetical protein